ncbi:MAG: hypothetical protein JRJ15_12015 [Deltaproteobacteria bacterium]|nr:hypothetical protein [Deltaproteobacteria bacterium]
MEADDIEKLFLRVLEDSGQDTDTNRQVFSILVKSTLEYRDRVLASKDVVVNVKDVRTSLDWLVSVLATGKMPASDKKISMDLLKIWLRELRSLNSPR